MEENYFSLINRIEWDEDLQAYKVKNNPSFYIKIKDNLKTEENNNENLLI